MGNKSGRHKKVDEHIDTAVISINTMLPSEILERVFHYLPIQDLKTTVQVCRRWREVGEAPGLWAKDYVRVNSSNLAVLPKMLQSRRYLTVKALDVCIFWMELTETKFEKLLRAVVSHQRVKVLSFTHAKLLNMSSVELQLLTKASTHLQELNLFGTNLTSPQITKLCTAQKDFSSLRKLNLGFNDISSVEVNAVYQIAKKLQVMNLAGTSLTHMQATAIFDAIAEGCDLKELNLAHNSKALELVDEDLLAKGVAKLEDVDLRNTSLTPYQINALFTEIGKLTKLKRLILKNINLSSAKPIPLVKAVIKLVEVDISASSVTHNHIASLCKGLGAGAQLKRLDISGNNLISTVEPMLVARAFTHLKDVTVFDAELTNWHVEAIFNAIGRSSHLRRLDIQNNNLSSVEPQAMAVAVNKLEVADLRNCSLAEQQVTGILTQSLLATCLKELKVWGSDVKVDQDLVTRSRLVIPKIDL